MYTHVCIHIEVYMRACVYIYSMYITCVYIYIYICIVYVYIYIYTIGWPRRISESLFRYDCFIVPTASWLNAKPS